ncbi:MAG: hypothetical protein ACJA2X_000385 [Halocynthiibacter sp.]|jgi:hypothetical protein
MIWARFYKQICDYLRDAKFARAVARNDLAAQELDAAVKEMLGR